MENKNSLTSLRFIAAFLVVGFHYFSFSPNYSFLNYIFARGHYGVDFFFILSGYVLTLRYYLDIKNNLLDNKKFILNRIFRIAPAYYLSLILALPFLIKNINGNTFLSNPQNISLYVLSNLTFTQSVLPFKSLVDYWNLPGWTLSVEFFFYLSFPLISTYILKKRRMYLWLVIFILMDLLIYLIQKNLPSRILFSGFETEVLWLNQVLVRLPQFFIGNLLAQIYLEIKYKPSVQFQYLITIIIILFLFSPQYPTWVTNLVHPISTMIFSIFIYTIAARDKAKGILNNKFLILLGEASYSLYIFQVPLKILFQQVFTKIFGITTVVGELYCFYIGTMLTVSSVIIYKFFEVPVNKFLRNKFIKN